MNLLIVYADCICRAENICALPTSDFEMNDRNGAKNELIKGQEGYLMLERNDLCFGPM